MLHLAHSQIDKQGNIAGNNPLELDCELLKQSSLVSYSLGCEISQPGFKAWVQLLWAIHSASPILYSSSVK